MLLKVIVIGVLLAKLLPSSTPLGQQLHKALIEVPADWLAQLKPRHLALAIVMVVALIALAPTVPLDLALLAAGDITAYLEVFAIVTALAAAAQSRSAWRSTRTAVVKMLRRISNVEHDQHFLGRWSTKVSPILSRPTAGLLPGGTLLC